MPGCLLLVYENYNVYQQFKHANALVVMDFTKFHLLMFQVSIYYRETYDTASSCKATTVCLFTSSNNNVCRAGVMRRASSVIVCTSNFEPGLVDIHVGELCGLILQKGLSTKISK